MLYVWSLIVEGIYIEFDAMLIGVCSPENNDVIIHPSISDTKMFNTTAEFYSKYNIGIVICSSYDQKIQITTDLNNLDKINEIICKVILGTYVLCTVCCMRNAFYSTFSFMLNLST